MTTWWKPLLGLALLLPVAAFVVGSLVATSTNDPAPRDTIVVEPADDESGDPSPRGDRPTADPRGPGDDAGDDAGDDGGDDRDDDRVQPDLRTPGDDDDDRDDDDDDDDRDDDDRDDDDRDDDDRDDD